MGEFAILGDWGTTQCRLHLLEGDRIRDGATGPGVKLTDDPARAFAEMTAGWAEIHGPLPTLLCGTIGANIGWVDAGYVPAPASLDHLLDTALSPAGLDHVTILPGVDTIENAFGLPDVMRSEETQVFGYLELTESSDALLCLPGSHTKWVEVEDGIIENLTTGFVGELLAALKKATILAKDEFSPAVDEEFRAGIDIGASHPSLLSALFSVRAGAARNELTPQAALDRLSGILIGADCAAMIRAWRQAPDAIIADGPIAEAYRAGLSHLGHEVPLHSGQDCVLAGLRLAALPLGLLDT